MNQNQLNTLFANFPSIPDDNLINYLFGQYSALVPYFPDKKYADVAMAILNLIKERDAALGVETDLQEQDLKKAEEWRKKHYGGDLKIPERSYPYNAELEKCLLKVDVLLADHGQEMFHSGVQAGARLMLELEGLSVSKN